MQANYTEQSAVPGKKGMQSSFEQRRKHTLSLLQENAGDKSRAGGVDEPIQELVALVNTLPDVYTTSSCSGRISVFADASAETRAQGKKGGQWIYVTHHLADAQQVLQALHGYCGQAVSRQGPALAPAVFRFEPFILAVEARDMQAAQRFIQTARLAGFRESGATTAGATPPRVMVGIRCSIRLEVPLLFAGCSKLAVSEDYICSLIEQANSKMRSNWARVQRFFELLRQPFQLQSAALPPAERQAQQQKGNASRASRARLGLLQRRQQAILTRLETLEGPTRAEANNTTSNKWQTLSMRFQEGLSRESLQRWGHSMAQRGGMLYIFGGYGGCGAHKRLTDLIAIDTSAGTAYSHAINGVCPEPRMGHVAAILGSSLVVHGGRTSPDQALVDVWTAQLPSSPSSALAWTILEPSAVQPAARHRHSAVLVKSPAEGDSMVIFGGCTHAEAYNDLWRLRVIDGEADWVQLQATGASPGPRHSHAAALLSCTMYIHGGRRHDNALLDDMWALDLRTLIWTYVTTSPHSSPPPLFSHTLAPVDDDTLLLLGGCPEQVAGSVHLYDAPSRRWSRAYTDVPSNMKLVPVRHTSCVLGGALHVIGGGAMCFSFGSTFSEPLLLDVRHLPSQSNLGAAPPTTHCLASSKGEQRLSVVDRHYDESARQPLDCSSLPANNASITRQERIVADGTEGSAAARPMQQAYLEPNGSGTGRQNRVTPCQCIGEGRHDMSIRLASASFALAHRDAGVGLFSAASSTSLPGKDAGAETEATKPLSSHHDGASSLSSSGIAHAPNGSPMTRPEQNTSASSFAGNPAVQETWVLQVEKVHAKSAKDALKALGFLDRRRKVPAGNRSNAAVALPVTPSGAAFLDSCTGRLAYRQNGAYRTDSAGARAFECSSSQGGLGHEDATSGATVDSRTGETLAQQVSLRELEQLIAQGVAWVQRKQAVQRSGRATPANALLCAALSVLACKGLSEAEIAALTPEIPSKWERLGDLALLPNSAFLSPQWAPYEQLWDKVAAALAVTRLARQAPIANTGTRDSQAALLKGGSGWVEHKENGTLYCLDVTRCMFSSGNVSEKARMGSLQCRGETVVDLFAGIGYYTLPLLVHAGVRHVYACEWNPSASQALKHNVHRNGVAERCTVLEGDATCLAPQGAADRVILGLLPSSHCAWRTALAALKDQGGWLHLHSNVKDSNEAAWSHATLEELSSTAEGLGRHWKITLDRIERVKWYAPHIRHVVLDIRCSATSAPADSIATHPKPSSQIPGGRQGRTIGNKTEEWFWREAAPCMNPLILEGCDWGPALERWSAEYILSLPSSHDKAVSVHVCAEPSGCMDFVRKNFSYMTMSLAELAGRCSTPQAYPPLIAPGERYYLRSLGANPRKEPSDVQAAFPELAVDLSLPHPPAPHSIFSSVLRISSGGLRLWAHFDVMSNLLCQIRGTKRIRMWPPSQETMLYVVGSSSEVTDIHNPDQKKYPLHQQAEHVDFTLNPGQALYIPALWLHSVLSEDFSISVNVFWRDLPREAYPRKDLYGNRDPLAAEAACIKAADAAAELQKLPKHFRDFYRDRCLRQLQDRAS